MQALHEQLGYPHIMHLAMSSFSLTILSERNCFKTAAICSTFAKRGPPASMTSLGQYTLMSMSLLSALPYSLLCLARTPDNAAHPFRYIPSAHQANFYVRVHTQAQYPEPISRTNIWGQYPGPISRTNIQGQNPELISRASTQSKYPE